MRIAIITALIIIVGYILFVNEDINNKSNLFSVVLVLVSKSF